MFEITEEQFWDAVNTSKLQELKNRSDFVHITYYHGKAETAYQVDTRDYEYVYIHEHYDKEYGDYEYYATK